MSALVPETADRVELGSRRVLRPGKLRWLRATGWALALFVLFMLVDAAAVTLPPAVADRFGDPAGVLLVSLICAAGFALYAGLVRLAEQRTASEIGLRRLVPETAAGLVIGAAMMTAVVGLLVATGAYEVTGPRTASAWDMVSISIASGTLEELIMRAIILRLAMRAFGVWPALVLQAALFGVMHLANPNASMTAAIAIALEAGLMLAGFYLLTGRIWMSVGVHAAWNFTQGWVWGAAVSGLDVGPSLFASRPLPTAPEWLSGGAFGPEASLPAMVVGTAVAVVVLARARRKGNFEARD
ncbi:CPBP family intramembrane glutamic endopeptidase [Phenylobacterium deserti]|uniref:CPBP family intramembrane metalloprotease n=1 Tax=Phenylobacterium deserti TaxID=1914756 RepID=A0A328AX98_9CAUL|nr:type II CAAX endopeptidase family protein [Phenylobacterium deserti]RAK58214.1 CPBP family intramembrane metalloprotease [Phenylobacterium deserti]